MTYRLPAAAEIHYPQADCLDVRPFELKSVLPAIESFSAKVLSYRTRVFNARFEARYGWDPDLNEQQLFVLGSCHDVFSLAEESRLLTENIRKTRNPPFKPIVEFDNLVLSDPIELERLLLSLARAGLMLPVAVEPSTAKILELRKATDDELAGKTSLNMLEFDSQTAGALKRVGFRTIETLEAFLDTFGNDYLVTLRGFQQTRSDQVLKALDAFRGSAATFEVTTFKS